MGIDPASSPWMVFGLALSFALAALSWHFLEAPLLARHRTRRIPSQELHRGGPSVLGTDRQSVASDLGSGLEAETETIPRSASTDFCLVKPRGHRW